MIWFHPSVMTSHGVDYRYPIDTLILNTSVLKLAELSVDAGCRRNGSQMQTTRWQIYTTSLACNNFIHTSKLETLSNSLSFLRFFLIRQTPLIKSLRHNSFVDTWQFVAGFSWQRLQFSWCGSILPQQIGITKTCRFSCRKHTNLRWSPLVTYTPASLFGVNLTSSFIESRYPRQ